MVCMNQLITKLLTFSMKNIINSLYSEQENKEVAGVNTGQKLFKDEELVTLIDPILSLDDSNNDGYIDYPEFIRAQQYAAATGRQ